MANEPENLVLVQLREIRAILEMHNKRFDQMEARFDGLDRKFDEWAGYVTHALGLCGIQHFKNEQQDARLDSAAAEGRRLIEQVAGLDQRVRRLEERRET